ncbi:MAG: hypothetical protein ACOX0F_04215 [Syntrophomonadaceae bacterium]|jgi:ubiquinone biosynthesis protein UbiJ
MFKFSKEKLEEQANKLAQKSGKLLESGKLKINITNLERDISHLKAELGDQLYNAYRNNTNAEAELMEICQKIDALYEQIDEIKKQIEDLQE